MDRDIIVIIDSDGPNQPKIMIENSEEDSTFVMMLSMVPEFQLKSVRSELIFVVDCSGSMGGQSMNLAKESLLIFLHSLPVDCYFNIICFGSDFTSLFPESRKYDDSNWIMIFKNLLVDRKYGKNY